MTPQEKIKNNEFLLSLDMSDASRDQKIAWLSQIIENEIQKPLEQQDLDLIAECTEYMMELSAGEITVPAERKEQALLEAKANNPAVEKKGRVIAKKPKLRLKIVAAIAALLVLSFSTLTVAAKVGGYSNAWDFVLENVGNISKMEPGDFIDGDGITLIKGGKSIAYGSIEELISTEGYDILYPSKLPNDIRITKITQQVVSETHIVWTFSFNNDGQSLSVSNLQQISSGDLSSYEVYETDKIVFYIKSFSNGSYQAIGYDQKYEYQIIFTDYESLITILSNMKGIEK